MISNETFCKALRLIQEQEKIDDAFSEALKTVGNGFLAFGADNKYLAGLMLVLTEAVGDKYGYIGWWLYEGEPDYRVWDDEHEWCLKEPEALYDCIVNNSGCGDNAAQENKEEGT